MSVLLRRLSTPISARGKQDARHVAVDAVSRQIDWAAVSRFFVVDGDEQCPRILSTLNTAARQQDFQSVAGLTGIEGNLEPL